MGVALTPPRSWWYKKPIVAAGNMGGRLAAVAGVLPRNAWKLRGPSWEGFATAGGSEAVISIDGAHGEGGGQILRTSLALSAIRELPVEIRAIRARREKPGLQAQHLTAVSALREICGAKVEGAALGSQRLSFAPGHIRSGDYRFDVGTAGSTTLVLQAILIPLALASGPSRVTLTGGTHVPWSPPADYVREVLCPALAAMGVGARLKDRGWGFYPKGGGCIVVEVEGGAKLRPVSLLPRGGMHRVRGISAVANLPPRIAERQRDRVLFRLEGAGLHADIAVVEPTALGAGSFLMLVGESGGVPAGFSALGERRKPAERVADEAVDDLLDFLKAEAGCDPYLADQLVLPMALASGTSRFTTPRITRHLLTAMDIAGQLLGCPCEVRGEEGSPGSVTIQGGEPRESWEAVSGSIPNPEPTAIWGAPVVRKARATDVPAIQRLVAHFALRGELLPRTLNELYERLRDFFVGDLGGEIVGICALSIYWEDLAEVRSLAVQETQKGRGLGTALVGACLEEAKSLGVRRVFALTYRPGFFEKLGFQTIDKRELPQKIWKDCIKCAKVACCDEVALIRET
jgi:RNA 3'-terminal phosphate cyclase (ATP)